MRQYRGFDVGRLSPKAMRQILQGMDVYLRQASRQFSANDTSDASTAGNLSSVAANGGTKRTGDITFSNTPTIQVTNTAQDFTWDIVSLPAVVFGSVGALGANTVLTDGVNLTAARSDHLHSIASAAHSGGYASATAVGAGNDFLRASSVFEFPSALMPVGTTKLVTLTDDATEGALLTSDNTFLANSIALKAPNATNTLRIGKYGNISLAGSALIDNVLCNFVKTDYNETATLPVAVVATLTNTNVGTGGNIARGFSITVNGSCTNAAAPTVNTIEGCRVALTGGFSTNNNFTGSLNGYRISSNSVSALTIGTSVPAIVDFQSSNSNIITRSAVTDRISFEAKGSITLSLSGTLTNHYGFKSAALVAGTNRYGVRVDGMTTGTPTVSIGLDVGSHSVGTDRWGVRTANKIENTATDFITSTAAKGYICKDGAGTPHYWRYTVAADGTPAIVDTGTSLPTA